MAVCLPYNEPVLSDPYCITTERAQIHRIRYTRTKDIDAITLSTDLSEWTTRLNDTSAGNPVAPTKAPIRTINGIGSTDVGEVTETPLPFGQTAAIAGNKTIAFRMVDMTPENIAAALVARSRGSVAVRFWAEAGTLLYGLDGIIARMTADVVIPEGETEIQSIQYNFTFRGGLKGAVASPFTDPFV